MIPESGARPGYERNHLQRRPRFSTRRMVREYLNRLYAPALQAIREWK
jgi:hypothetical protein